MKSLSKMALDTWWKIRKSLFGMQKSTLRQTLGSIFKYLKRFSTMTLSLRLLKRLSPILQFLDTNSSHDLASYKIFSNQFSCASRTVGVSTYQYK